MREILFFSLLCVIRLLLIWWPALLIIELVKFLTLRWAAFRTLECVFRLLSRVEQNFKVGVAAWDYAEDTASVIVVGQHLGHFGFYLGRGHRESERFGSLATFQTGHTVGCHHLGLFKTFGKTHSIFAVGIT